MYELGTRERQAIGKEFVEIIFYTSYPEDIIDMRSFDRKGFCAATQHGNWHEREGFNLFFLCTREGFNLFIFSARVSLSVLIVDLIRHSKQIVI